MEYIKQIKLMEAYVGIPQAQTAHLLGISPQNYSRKLKNKTFTVKDLEKIADVLGFDMEIVFTDRKTGRKI